MSQPKDNKVIINGTEQSVANDEVSYEQVVDLAFPTRPNDPNIYYKVTYSKAQSQPHQGSLAPGGKVTVKHNGTVFDVTPTNKS